MINERITEQIIRNELKKANYFKNVYNDILDIKIYEQKTNNNILDNLLDKASKNEIKKNKGYPDFIIFLEQYNIVIIVECKGDKKKHYSQNLDKPKEYAVDGAIWYSQFFFDKFDTIAMGISGQNQEELKITKYFYKKKINENEIIKPFKIKNRDKELESPKEIYQYYLYENKLDKINNFEKIASKLHQQLHESKVSQHQKSMIISIILLALSEKDFQRTYRNISSEETLVSFLIDSMVRVLKKNELISKSIETIKNNSLFLLNHPIARDFSPYKLSYFIKQLEDKIFKYMKGEHKEIYTDELGYFYNEFLKHTGGGDGKGLGIVLTPFHICELFTEIANVNEKSRVIDICAGTGGFLVASLKKMMENDVFQKKEMIKKNNIIGFEIDPNIFSLLIANMIIRNNEKPNCLNIDCIEEITIKEINEKYKPNVGFLNPPYSMKNKELEFVIKMLDSLEPQGLGITILPISCCKSENDLDLRKEILSRHQLLGIMSMKNNLFRRSSGINTNILVFRVHSIHKDKTFVTLWKNDGLINKKGSVGWKDEESTWEETKKKWVDQFNNKEIISGKSNIVYLKNNDEWIAENHMINNFDKFTPKLLAKHIYSTIKQIFRPGKKIEFNQFKEISYRKIEEKFFFDIKNNWKKININNLFQFFHFNSIPKKIRKKGEIPFIGASKNDNGISEYIFPVKGYNVIDYKCITFGAQGNVGVGNSFYQINSFIPSSTIWVLKPKFKINNFNGPFIAALLETEKFRYNFGNSVKLENLKNTYIFLPFDKENNIIDWKKIEKIVKKIDKAELLEIEVIK